MFRLITIYMLFGISYAYSVNSTRQCIIICNITNNASNVICNCRAMNCSDSLNIDNICYQDTPSFRYTNPGSVLQNVIVGIIGTLLLCVAINTLCEIYKIKKIKIRYIYVRSK